MIIPSIDIMDGQVVQLKQGRENVLTDSRSPEALAREFAKFGPVAVIDLNAAMGTGHNTELVTACCQAAPCRVGGGIRTEDDVLRWIRRGAEQVIVGTRATPDFLEKFPREWLIAAVDARDGEVVVEGWQKSTGQNVHKLAQSLAPLCSELLYTCVEREGMLGGAAIESALALADAVDVPVTVAGGIASVSEMTNLISAGCNVQVGRAVYENRIDLADAWVAQIAFDDSGLVPTVVQDASSGVVRMLAYSNRESLGMALRTGEGWYYSRSRKKLWRKGESSANTQEVVRARWDCDRDAIVFTVNQIGPTCHTGQSSCFGSRDRDALRTLDATLGRRSREQFTGTYTQRLLNDPTLLNAKLREEIEEVIEAESVDDVAWEVADVVYHVLVKARGCGVAMDRVCDELRSRSRN